MQNSLNQPPPIVADPNGRQFSKYLPPQAEVTITKKATVGLCPRSRSAMSACLAAACLAMV